MLVADAKRGERGAFVELVHRYDRDVLRLALHVTGTESTATEIYLQAFVKAFESLASFEFEHSFQVWILRISARLCAAFLEQAHGAGRTLRVRSHSKRDEFDLVEHAAKACAGLSVERAAPDRRPTGRMGDALSRLTPRERLVVELKHSQRLQLNTIAEILDISEESAKAALIGGTQKLLAAFASKESASPESRDNFLDAVT